MKVSSNMLRRFVCGALVMTSIVFISGCEFNVDHFKSMVNNKPQVTEKAEDEESRVFHFYLAAVNTFNFDDVKFHQEYTFTEQGLQSGQLVDPFVLPDYDRLEQELIAANEAGKTYINVRNATDDVLPVLHKIVEVTKTLQDYNKAQKEGQSATIDINGEIQRYIALKQEFDPIYMKLAHTVRKQYVYEAERNVTNMRSAGQINLAKVTEIRLIYTLLLNDLDASNNSIDANKVLKDISCADEISRDIKSAEAQNFLDARMALNDAIKIYIENPSYETSIVVTAAYNNMMEAPMNYKLLDNLGDRNTSANGHRF